MNEHIIGELIDKYISIIETLASGYDSMAHTLNAYALLSADNRDLLETETFHLVERHSRFLLMSFVGILNREPEVGAFRHYVPNFIWGKETWAAHLSRLIDLPEVIGRYAHAQSSTSVSVVHECLPVAKDILIGLEQILASICNITDSAGKQVLPASEIQLRPEDFRNYVELALSLVATINDVLSLRVSK